MEKCKRKHCEFAWNGQCCLVCPKGLYRVDPREVERRRIERCIKKLERVMKRLPKENRYGLPRGIRSVGKRYAVSVTVDGKTYNLGTFAELDKAMDVRADATKAKENGDFGAWLGEFEAKRKASKKGKKTAEKEVSKNDERA